MAIEGTCRSEFEHLNHIELESLERAIVCTRPPSAEFYGGMQGLGMAVTAGHAALALTDANGVEATSQYLP